MIKKLTKEQEKQLEVYREKYINIGLNTDKIDRNLAKENINNLYEKILGRKKPEHIIFFDSPLKAWGYISNHFYYDLIDEFKKECRNIWVEINDQIVKKMKQIVYNIVLFEVFDFIKERISNVALELTYLELNKQFKNKYSHPYIFGCYEAPFFAYYDFIFNEFKLKVNEKIIENYNIWKNTLDCGLTWCFPDRCIISEKPVEIKIEIENKKVKEGKIKYMDNFKINYIVKNNEWVRRS